MTLTKYRAVLLLAAIVVIAYANTLKNGFVWDDGALVTRNNLIRNSTYLDTAFVTELFRDNPTSIAYYRPLQTISYMIDYFFWGVTPAGYHLTNLLLHLLCVLLVWSLMQNLARNRSVAFLVAGLFAVHPVNTNAVAYVSGRADLLALAGMLSSLLLFLRLQTIPESERFTRIVVFIGSLLCYIGALFSRENALLLPILIVLRCFILDPIQKDKLIPALVSAAPFAAVSASFLVWRSMVLGSCSKPWFSEMTMPMGLRLQVFFRAAATYACTILWPARLQTDRQLTGGGWLHVFTVAGIVIVVGVAWMMHWSHRASRLMFFGLCWFVITLFPMMVLNLVAPVAEHWLYVPSIGLYLAVFTACAHALGCNDAVGAGRLRRVVGYACVIALTALTARTIRRNQDWASDSSLYSLAAPSTEQSLRVQVNLAHMHLLAGQLDEALSDFQRLEQRCQHGPLVQIVKGNLATVYQLRGDLDRAVAKNEECLKLDPKDSDAWMRLAGIWEQRGNFVQAQRSFMAATAVSMAMKPRLSLGEFLVNHNRLREALQVVEEAYAIEPGNADVFNLLGTIFAQDGQIRKAKEAFEMARALDRHSPDANLNLARLASWRGNATKTAKN